ncbi:ATP-binding protein [Sphingomicrobium sp. XHP0239]|uniref:ATP-binding protein n=1 Tax=Sphingomicrobium maritimum TaxID=3133972 RepID=UPI0031CCD94E
MQTENFQSTVADRIPGEAAPNEVDLEFEAFRNAWVTAVRHLSETRLRKSAEELLRVYASHLSDPDAPHFDLDAIAPNDRPAIAKRFARPAPRRPLRKSPLKLGITALCQMVGADEASTRIALVLARSAIDQRWEELLEALGKSGRQSSADFAAISPLVGLSATEFERCVASSSKLVQAGLIGKYGDGEIRTSDLLIRVARSGISRKTDLKRLLLPEVDPTNLDFSDFDHLGDVASLVRRIVASGAPASLLFYGPPGTGKTEFAKLIAKDVGRRPILVGETDANGEEPDRRDRLQELRTLQAITGGSNDHLLIFDEADDVLILGGGFPAKRSKMWLNNLVDRPQVPLIWIMNETRAIEESIIRRMALAIRFDKPSRSKRERIALQVSRSEGIPLHKDEAAQLAQLDVTPAIVAGAMKTASRIGGNAKDAILAGEEMMLATTGRRPRYREQLFDFDPDLSNADIDLRSLCDRLVHSSTRGWSMLLSGPSGTGKSAYARFLARRLGLDLIEKRGSDLLDCYVGGTEQAIADAFAEARRSRSLLLIDEADDFLADRRAAHRSWERSQTNELLRQMEDLEHPFVATTNLATMLDPASQRRFALRVSFDSLNVDQSATLFRRMTGEPLPTTGHFAASLTPGDFDVVRRRAALLGERDPDVIAGWLAKEAAQRLSN